MLLNTFTTWVIVLGVLLASSFTSTGQTFKGCGAFINSNGDILTSTQVIGEPSDSIIVQDYRGTFHHATIKKIDNVNGLTLISIKEKMIDCAYLRMHDEEVDVFPPVVGELSSVIGYIKGLFTPRGALVGEVADPNLPYGHFRVRMGCAYNCSGAPILDDYAMLIGIIAKGTTENDTVKQDSTYEPPAIYGLDATLILPCLDLAKVGVTYTNKRDPYKLKQLRDPMERIEKTVYIGSVFTVLIFN